MHRKESKIEKKQLNASIVAALFAVCAVLICIASCIKLSIACVEVWQTKYITMLVSFVIAALGIVTLFGLFIFFTDREFLKKPKGVFILVSIVLISTALSTLMSFASPFFSATLLAVILVGILVKKELAYPSAVMMATVISVVTIEPASGIGAYMCLCTLITALTGGLTAALMLNVKKGRLTPSLAGLVGGTASALSLCVVQALCGAQISESIVPMLWLIGGGSLCGVVATGILPLLEVAFDIATDARLNELMNNNNPLMKRLMVEAPGTYHHSMLVATLAEAAAEQVGANSLLCKAAGYYHDVGKLRSPMHFKENQRDFNIHDTLDPCESAQRIIAHRRDGVTLLMKNNIPSDVVKIASEHHGNSTVLFFYNEALKRAADGEKVDEADFKYNASKPSTKESAIIMLADCCEAAVRSIKQPTHESIGAKVHDVIGNLWLKQDGQLSECPLTARDILLIQKSFVKTLSAQYHERIEYPTLEEIENAKK